jgi:recombinational DNA repair ATPase RecF
MDFYRITKIRLVNFHNFVDETIEVRDGGHLFMLGDNGSGKTTVLDAVHYVLCPGKSMEFNAAARVAGARHTGGRSIHGVVMRYNLEANGPLNPNGGITYAALEIAGRHGRPVSAAVGIATRGMDEDVERWFVLRECPVADLPLLSREEGRARPATKAELKAALPNGYYGQVNAYLEDLSERFFHDRETYDDVCKLLATGKAYREIASRTGDYHQLFRELLQEPPREVFEDVVTNLKSLEESRQDLDRLREKAQFVENLATFQQDVLDARIDHAAALWQENHLEARAQQAAFDATTERLAAEEHRLAGLHEEQKRLAIHVDLAATRLENLRRQDEGGLVQQEREARLAMDKAKQEFEQAKRALVAARQSRDDAAAAVARTRDALRKQADALARDLHKAGRVLPFSAAALAGTLDDAAKAEAPEAELGALQDGVGALRGEADTTAQTLDRQLQTAEDRLEQLDKRLAALAADIDEKRARGETVPLVKGFAQAQRAIQQRLLKAQPLYAGLEPAAGLTSRELVALEQLIGDAALATWVTDEANAAELRGLLFREFPEQSLAVVNDNVDPVPSDWLRQYFDFQTSDPAGLLVLQHQVAARQGPHIAKFLDTQVLTFRLREQPLADAAPRLIGLELRRRELEREVRDLEKKRAAATKERKDVAAELDGLRERRADLERFRRLLDEIGGGLARQREAVARSVGELALKQHAFETAQSDCQYHEEELQGRVDQHADLQISLRKAGLEGLEDRIRKVQREADKLRKDHDEALREAGRVEAGVGRAKEQGVFLQREIARALGERDAAQAALLALVVPEGSLDAFVRTRCAAVADDRAALRERAGAAREAAAAGVEKVKSAVRLNIGTAFGFVYDDAANTLHDRRGRALADVLDGSRTELREQEELINEQTLRLFRQIVMDRLVNTLQTSVLRLTNMATRINQRLKDRAFGTNRYLFAVTPQDAFKRLVELVRNYRALNPEETERELREFIEDHAAEIQGTEVGDVPRILDYREWFRYELKVLTTTADGIVMDRKVKSIGSGGEQAVPNYLLILTIAHFLYDKEHVRLPTLIFDEAFYGIDAGRRDQLLGFASDLDLQLFVASPDQDGVKREVAHSTSVLVVKDAQYNVHLYPYHWTAGPKQTDLLDTATQAPDAPPAFGPEA